MAFDLVKIGYSIKADGLLQAEKAIDNLLDKVGKLENKKVKINVDSKDLENATSKLGKGKNVEVGIKAKATQDNKEQFKAELQRISKNMNMVFGGKFKLDSDAKTNVKEQIEKLSGKYKLGLGIKLDLGKQTADSIKQQLDNIQNKYKLNVQVGFVEKAQQTRARLVSSNADPIGFEQTKTKYVQEGFQSTAAGKLARLELSGADVNTLENYKKALQGTKVALDELNAPTVQAISRTQGLINTLGNIGKFAILSTVVYGLIEAFKFLTVSLVTTADQFASTQARIGLYIKDAKEVNNITKELAIISIESNTPLRETAALFAKITPTLQKMGASTKAVTNVVESFTKSFRISGATLKETEAATIQFAQAMASGRLQGDEFRTMSEAAPRFLKAIVDGAKIATPALGITAENIKQLGSEGKLTSEILSKALLASLGDLRKEAKDIGYTFEQGVNGIATGFTLLVGKFNEGAGATRSIGTILAEIGKSMVASADKAKEFGENVKAFFSAIKGTAQVVAEALKFVTIALGSLIVVKTVAAAFGVFNVALLITRLSLGGFAAQTAIATVGMTAMQRVAFSATGAITALGSALRFMSTFTGGFLGLAATLAGIAATYLFLKDNAAEATAKLVEQSGVVDITAESWVKLNKEQRENARLKIDESLKETNDKLREQADKVNQQFSLSLRNRSLNADQRDQLLKTLTDVKSGVKSYDDAIKEARGKGLISGVAARELQKTVDVYNSASKEALKFKDGLKLVGENAILSGNNAQNTALQFDKAKESLNEANAAASNFGKSLKDLSQPFTLELKNKITQGNLAKSLKNNNKGLTEEVANTLANIAVQQQQIGKDGKVIFPITQEQLNLGLQQSAIDTQKKAREEAANTSKTLRDQREAYLEQIDTIQRLDTLYNSTGQRAISLDVAKIASSKEYIKLFGQSLDVAERKAEAEKKLKQIDFEDNADRDITNISRLLELAKQGFNIEKARNILGLEYTNQQKQVNLLRQQAGIELNNQNIAAQSSVAQNKEIYKFVAAGYSIEEAKAMLLAKQAFSLDNSAESQKIIADEQARVLKSLRDQEAYDNLNKVIATTKNLEQQNKVLKTGVNPALLELRQQYKGVVDQSLLALMNTQGLTVYLKELNNGAISFVNLTTSSSSAVADLKNQFFGINDEQAKSLINQRKAIDFVKQYYDEQEKAKANPLGDFSNIDFNVFGDFGNPFKDAIDGLNSFIGGFGTLKETFTATFEQLGASIETLKGQRLNEELFGNTSGADALSEQIEKQTKLKLDLEKDYESKRSKMFVQGIASSAKAAKGFFKEQSTGYRVLNKIEKASAAVSIALEIQKFAIKSGLMKTDLLQTLATNAKKQLSDGVTAVISSMKGLPFPLNIAAMGATIAAIAGLGVAIAGGSKAKGSFAPTNEGTGTVFGDTSAKSESIKKSIDLLANNSKAELPISTAMLRSLQNIESNIGGLTNLLIRNEPASNLANSVGEGIKASSLLKNPLFGLGLSGGILGKFFGLDKILGSAFGTKTTIKGQGLLGTAQSVGDIQAQGFQLSEFVDVNRKKKFAGLTTSNKNSTQTSAADAELANQFGLIIGGFADSILLAAPTLDQNLNDVSSRLNNFVVDIGKINLQGLSGEQIQEKLTAVFGAAADNMTRAALGGLDDFQKVGEGYFETIVRVATGIELATNLTARLGLDAIKYTEILNKQGDVTTEIVRQSALLVEKTKDVKGGVYDMISAFNGTGEELFDFIKELRELQNSIIATGKDGKFLSTSMIIGAGTLSSLKDGLDAFFEMLSPQEQATELTRRMTEQFSKLGKSLPNGVKGFREMIGGIDVSTEQGQKLYGQLIALAPEFTSLQDALESASNEVNSLVQSLRDLAEEANKNIASQNPTLNLNALRSQFAMQSALAATGDTEAAKLLPQLGKDLMSASKLYSVTGGQFANDLAMIQSGATIAANVQASGNGFESGLTPNVAAGGGSLTPNGVSGTSSVSNNNGTVSQDQLVVAIDALRTDINANLLAVAKNTLKAKDLLERWDNGNSMTVTVEQEPDVPPLRVTTV